MSSVEMASQQSQKSSRRRTPEAMSADVSPDSKCPICLDLFNNISYLDLCLHKFCFQCIREWSKNKAECPLCKQPFNSIYHTIKSEQDFQKYDLRPVNNGSFGTFGGVRFRYRTTLTGLHRQMRARTSLPQDTGVMFDGPTTSSQQHQDRYIRHMMMRLAAKGRAESEGRTANKVREQEMINFRRDLYRRGVKVRTVQDGGRSRDITAKFYRKNPACLHRLVPWLKRELLVLYGPDGSLVNMVQHIIMSNITRHDVEMQTFQDEIRPFLQGRTEHFLHEFISFAKSPFNVETYDHHAVYDCPPPSSNEDSSSSSSIIAISEDEEQSVDSEHPRESTPTLGHSTSDNETPGPSNTVSVVRRTEHPLVLESDSDSSSEEETQDFGTFRQQMSQQTQTDTTRGEIKSEACLLSDSDDCVIVSYVKPTAERTPELVQLSSNSSDESGSDDATEVPPEPQHIRFPSVSPPATPGADLMDSENVDGHHQTDRHKTPRKSDRKDKDRRCDVRRRRHRSKDREHRRRRSSSRQHRHSSRSPVIPQSTITVMSRERGYGYFSGRDSHSKCDSNFRWKDNCRSYLSYRHYSQERHNSGTHYTERQSCHSSTRKYSGRHSSHSRSRSRSRDSRRAGRRYSQSESSSRSSSVEGRSHQDKPGGKRKYKTRHLEAPFKDTSSKSSHQERDSPGSSKHKKKSKEKRRKRSKERSRKTSRRHSEEHTPERSKRHHKKRKKHKKKSKRHRTSECTEKSESTVVTITIDSDSDSWANVCINQVSSTTNKDSPVENATDAPVDHAAVTPPS